MIKPDSRQATDSPAVPSTNGRDDNAVPAPMVEGATQFLLTKLSDGLGYFNAKENLALQVTALYLGTVAWFIVQENPFWRDFGPIAFAGLGVVVVMVTCGVYWLVNWQLQMRALTNYELAACENLLTRWLTVPPTHSDLEATPRSGLLVAPKALAEEYERLTRIGDPGLDRFKWPIRLSVIGGGIAALIRLAVWVPHIYKIASQAPDC